MPLLSNDWMERSACKDADPELFFPEPQELAKLARAQAICGGCPVRMQCLVYAAKTPWLRGVWGGLSERQRNRYRKKAGIKRQYNRPAGRFVAGECGTPAAARRHYRRGERPCEPCRAAAVDATRRWKSKNKGVAE